jgi:metal-responsive CopG/Arc/MetJ family transcriptional regulator
MADATETELIGVTLPKKWIKQIDEKIKDDPMTNRQDFIRNVIKKELEVKC